MMNTEVYSEAKWQTGKTKVIRVPIAIVDEVMIAAVRIDNEFANRNKLSNISSKAQKKLVTHEEVKQAIFEGTEWYQYEQKKNRTKIEFCKHEVYERLGYKLAQSWLVFREDSYLRDRIVFLITEAIVSEIMDKSWIVKQVFKS